LELYTEKSGEEIVGQLYHFQDKGEREVALRPEMTPTLARMVASQHRNYRKPIKWFSVPRLFRYERPQKGRHREHYQWNCDMVGEKSAMAEAELIGTLCLGLSLLGLNSQDVVVRVSDRSWWDTFLEKHGVGEKERPSILRTLDRLDGATAEQRREKLGALAGAVEEVWQGKSEDSAALREVHKGVKALGYGGWCETDYRVVRGLAYYTGVVFEVHDRAEKLRAVAGGGRYDDLLKRLGGEDLPAVGFGMGDAVLAELLREKKMAVAKVEGAEIFVVAEGSEQEMALGLVGQLRRGGFSADYDPGAGKWGKQLEMAEAKGARWALLVGREVAEGKLGLKELATRKQSEIRWTKGGDGKICLEPTPGEWAKVLG
jgi:histidyl-tRNA synthetase